MKQHRCEADRRGVTEAIFNRGGQQEAGKLVTFLAGPVRYGVAIERVLEMTLLGVLDPIANAPDWMRGLMRLRERVIPVIDLRLRLSLPSLQEEHNELRTQLGERKADHIHWLEQLEVSVFEGKRFSLATDPHKCAFGRWYDAFTTSDPMLARHVTKFGTPHERIHAIAQRCIALAAKGGKDEAQEIIAESRDTDLAEIIDLFDSTVALIAERERQMVLVLRIRGDVMGFAVDEIDSVISYSAEQVVAGGAAEGYGPNISAVVRTSNASLVQVLDVEAMTANQFASAEPA